jgi:hypothetical protein
MSDSRNAVRVGRESKKNQSFTLGHLREVDASLGVTLTYSGEISGGSGRILRRPRRKQDPSLWISALGVETDCRAA